MEAIELQEADFLDFGCSNGSSMVFAKQRFGASKGIGIDIDPVKVAKARGAGFEAMEADASALRLPPGIVSFCVMSHFLEHLPGLRVAEKCIASACNVARDFVYIRHPWFDADYDLWKLGYKFYWSDWSGHTANIGAAQLDMLLRRAGAKAWTLYGLKPIIDLNDQAIVPLNAPINTLEQANDRPSTPLAFPAFKELAALIQTGSDETYQRTIINLARDHIPLK